MKTNLSAFVIILFLAISACNKESINNPIPAQSAQSNEQAVATFHIGEAYGGGIIYFIDSTGQHGLIAATQDIGNSAYKVWNNGSNGTTKATATGLYMGALNTDKIIYFQGTGDYAAADCRSYNGGGYTDWYLPSKRETVLLRKNGGAAGLSLSSNGYYTSTEADVNSAYCVSVGPYVFALDKSIPASVRAIRAF